MKKYRVEAFIIPTNVKQTEESNQIDDEKLALKLREQSFSSTDDLEEVKNVSEEEKPTSDNSVKSSRENVEDEDEQYSEFSSVFFDIHEHIYDEIKVLEVKENKPACPVKNEKTTAEYTKAFFRVEEPIYDEPFVGNLTRLGAKASNNNGYDVPQTNRWTLASSKYRRFGIVAPKLPKRSSSLQSISEDIESLDDTLQEICGHGRPSGCLAHQQQRPEDISDEIFKENWMQRLDGLRKLESLLKDKELALQSRERLLFKKEKELRILERLVKDKMKQAELYAKRYKKALSSAESVAHEEPEAIREHARSDGSSNSLNLASKANSKDSLDSREEKTAKNPPNSRSSSMTDRLSSRIGSTRSRSRPRQKIRYDDLDSTLSADIGDSSFIVTSKKFDPTTFKKPAAFVRSASERRPRCEQQVSISRLKSVTEQNEYTDDSIDVLEEKALKKISENIIASQNQESKFLNYGLIDGNATMAKGNVEKVELANQKRFSYLNLESINKTIKSKIKPKERPTSWSEDTDDWLRKKRQAYNLAAKKMAIDNVTGKENFDRHMKIDKSTKVTKKKDNNQKKFSIFR